MKLEKMKFSLLLGILPFLSSCVPGAAQRNDNVVKTAGSMYQVMRKGELFGTIDLDTITNKTHLYGVGPLEYLKGEITIIDGKCYISTIDADENIRMEESFSAKDPFFVYAHVSEWMEEHLPDTIQTIRQLETFLSNATTGIPRPFVFKLAATVDSAVIHVLNLPDGTKVSSHEEGHQNQKDIFLSNEAVQIVGFFSTEHKGIFTHHDSYVHLHLITQDNAKMGHLDYLTLQKGTARLYLPK